MKSRVAYGTSGTAAPALVGSSDAAHRYRAEQVPTKAAGRRSSMSSAEDPVVSRRSPRRSNTSKLAVLVIGVPGARVRGLPYLRRFVESAHPDVDSRRGRTARTSRRRERSSTCCRRSRRASHPRCAIASDCIESVATSPEPFTDQIQGTSRAGKSRPAANTCRVDLTLQRLIALAPLVPLPARFGKVAALSAKGPLCVLLS